MMVALSIATPCDAVAVALEDCLDLERPDIRHVHLGLASRLTNEHAVIHLEGDVGAVLRVMLLALISLALCDVVTRALP